MKKEVMHCCKDMFTHLGDDSMTVKYLPITREYGFEVPSPEYPVAREIDSPLLRYTYTLQPITHCPWCGKEFFYKSVRNEYLERIEINCAMISPIDTQNNPNLPQKYKTEEWWRERCILQ